MGCSIWCINQNFWNFSLNGKRPRTHLRTLSTNPFIIITLYSKESWLNRCTEIGNCPLVDSVLAWKNSWHFMTPPIVNFPAKWRLWNDCRNFKLMTCHYPSYWLQQISLAAWPIKNDTPIRLVTHHLFRISVLEHSPKVISRGKLTGGG